MVNLISIIEKSFLMQNRSFLSFFLPFLAFVIFGAISCWATSESLFLSFLGGAAIPKIVFWVVVVGFYVVTSLGTKWIIDSFNTQAYVSHRRLKLIGGLLIVIAFWLLVSLPTNAHTFLYKRSAKTVAQRELKWQETQLDVITDVDAYSAKLMADINQQETEINQLKTTLIGEIKHPDRLGFAEKAEMILQEIEGKMGLKIGSIPRTKMANTSEKEINRLTMHYSNAIDEQVSVYVDKLTKNVLTLIANYEKSVKDAKDALKYNHAAYIALNADDEVQEDVLREARKQINHDYNIIDGHKVEGAESSREKYINVEKGMPSNRLTNVVEVVYKDYLSGDLSKKYDMPETKGMIYFILLSLMIDIAAFLFFNIAFRNNK